MSIPMRFSRLATCFRTDASRLAATAPLAAGLTCCSCSPSAAFSALPVFTAAKASRGFRVNRRCGTVKSNRVDGLSSPRGKASRAGDQRRAGEFRRSKSPVACVARQPAYSPLVAITRTSTTISRAHMSRCRQRSSGCEKWAMAKGNAELNDPQSAAGKDFVPRGLFRVWAVISGGWIIFCTLEFAYLPGNCYIESCDIFARTFFDGPSSYNIVDVGYFDIGKALIGIPALFFVFCLALYWGVDGFRRLEPRRPQP